MEREKLKTAFRNVFTGSVSPIVVRSPGRVNIIGEHTDYNGGFVLPAAIDKAIYVVVEKRNDDLISLYSAEYQQHHDVTTTTIVPTEKQWPNYILGVADQLQQRGHTIGGFNLLIDGDVPLGAGLSSSAAVECATVFALNELFELGLAKIEMVQIAQKAEQVFAGVMCGIMDQFASMFGKHGHVIKLDCRSLEYEYVPFDLKGYKLVLFNTNVKHSLSSSAYNTRREQCEQGVAWIAEHVPGVTTLRDATLEMLNTYVKPKDELIYTRCKYVVEEIARLQEACDALHAGDVQTMGQKMFATHDGLSKEYEVSCAELDFLVDAVRTNPNVLGARMMGGGFGGCTINIVKEEMIDELVATLSKAYQSAMQKELTAFVVQIENGTGLVL